MSLEITDSFVRTQIFSVAKWGDYIKKYEDGWAFPTKFFIEHYDECHADWRLILDRCAILGIYTKKTDIREAGKGFLISRYPIREPVTFLEFIESIGEDH